MDGVSLPMQGRATQSLYVYLLFECFPLMPVLLVFFQTAIVAGSENLHLVFT